LEGAEFKVIDRMLTGNLKMWEFENLKIGIADTFGGSAALRRKSNLKI